MLSIAFFSECYHPIRNGVVVSVASFARVLTEMGHEVTIFTARHPDQDEKGDAETGVYRFPAVMPPTRAKYPIAFPIATGKARKLLAEHHFDIIHSNSPMLMGHVAIAYHKRRNIPLVFTYHTLIEEYAHYIPLPQTWVRRRAIRLSREYSNEADHIITPTEYVASRLRRYRVTKPITVIPTGIDIDLMVKVPDGDIRAQYDIPVDAPLLVYAGRIAREKNIPRILTSFREVLRQEPKAYLLLSGGGPFEDEIREALDELAIAGQVRMTGFVPREHIVQCMRAADVFVFASQTETQGLVLGEAMACARPVVAVAASATSELIDTGKEGILVPDADAPFADAVIKLIHQPELRQTLGFGAQKRAETLSAYRCTERLVGVYNRVLAGRP